MRPLLPPFTTASAAQKVCLAEQPWTLDESRIAYEWHDDSGTCFRSFGNEHREFNAYGLMIRRIASINDLPIAETDRKPHWPLGRRPDDHPALIEPGL